MFLKSVILYIIKYEFIEIYTYAEVAKIYSLMNIKFWLIKDSIWS